MSDTEFKAALGDMHKNIEAQMQVISEKSEQKGAEFKTAVDNLDGSIKSLNDQILELAQKHSVPAEVIEKKSFGALVMDSEAVKKDIARDQHTQCQRRGADTQSILNTVNGYQGKRRRVEGGKSKYSDKQHRGFWCKLEKPRGTGLLGLLSRFFTYQAKW